VNKKTTRKKEERNPNEKFLDGCLEKKFDDDPEVEVGSWRKEKKKKKKKKKTKKKNKKWVQFHHNFEDSQKKQLTRPLGKSPARVIASRGLDVIEGRQDLGAESLVALLLPLQGSVLLNSAFNGLFILPHSLFKVYARNATTTTITTAAAAGATATTTRGRRRSAQSLK